MSGKVQNLFAFIIVLTGLVLFWFGVIGALNDLEPKRAALAARQNEITLLNRLLAKETQVFEKFAQAQTQAQKIFQAIPRNLVLSETVETIRGLANAAGLVIERIKITPNQSSSASEDDNGSESLTKQATIELGAKGSYEGLRIITRAIETNLPLLDIEKVRIQAGSGQDQQLQMDLQLTTYYLE